MPLTKKHKLFLDMIINNYKNDNTQNHILIDKIRDYFKKTAAANEGLDTAANIGGNTLLALTPMGAIGRGASIGSAALKSGALGALQGAGESEADTASGVAKDAAIGGAISGALGGASQGLSKGLSKGFAAVKSKLMTPAAKEAIQETGEATAKLTFSGMYFASIAISNLFNPADAIPTSSPFSFKTGPPLLPG